MKPHVVRAVLGISMILMVLAFALIQVFGSSLPIPDTDIEASLQVVFPVLLVGIGPAAAETAIRMTGGLAESVTDEEILRMQRDLARKEGIGVEPASAASVAGIRKLVEQGMIDKDERIVCVVTGHLLKDPDTVIQQCEPPTEIDADLPSLLSALHL